jgi:L-2-hydroxyglutarate oxidase LhgO
MTIQLEAVVIGAGVVGLACARELAMKGFETYVLEKESTFGAGVSARNSEVIHAGLYYPTDSLKAKLCVKGRKLLYEYCHSKNIPHKKIGKWVAAKQSSEEKLHNIYRQALANGCHEVSFIIKSEAVKIEPQLTADLILNSPETGIVDVHSLMMALLVDFESNAGHVIFKSEVNAWEVNNRGILLKLNDAEQTTIQAKYVVNSAGLNAVPLLEKLVGFPKNLIPPYWYAKGNYFSLTGTSPFSRLIYPLPEKDGLGIHLTLDLGGKAKFGPDVEKVTELDYGVNPERAFSFVQAIKCYWKNINIDLLQPDYSGIRPKIGRGDAVYNDFMIQDQTKHKIAGLINLLGIESPGITASLAIADVIARNLRV